MLFSIGPVVGRRYVEDFSFSECQLLHSWGSEGMESSYSEREKDFLSQLLAHYGRFFQVG
jgi:hypothetical protein